MKSYILVDWIYLLLILKIEDYNKNVFDVESKDDNIKILSTILFSVFLKRSIILKELWHLYMKRLSCCCCFFLLKFFGSFLFY